MKERENIEFPLWRKKVDATFLQGSETPIPNWLLDIWDIKKNFGHVYSKKNDNAIVEIIFNRKKYKGYFSKFKRGVKIRPLLVLLHLFLYFFIRSFASSK